MATLPDEPNRLSDALRDELRRRIAEDDARPDDAILWEEAKAMILAKLTRPRDQA